MEKVITDRTILARQASNQLSERSMFLLVALLTSFPMLSTDLYLPALPVISDQLHASVAFVNLTLIVFFVFLSGSALIWGPLSDKYGRKRILMIGLPLYLLSSIFCAISGNIFQLIGARIFQAIGGGASMGVTLAIIKDFFPGKKREKIIAFTSMMTGLVPVVAPAVGAQIVELVSWRGSFVVLALMSAFAFWFLLQMKETNMEPSLLSVPRTTLRLFTVLRNPNFARLVGLFAAISIPIFGYISISSFIYIKLFGLSESAFGLYFGFTALFFVCGGAMYLLLSRTFKPVTLISAAFLICAASGVLMFTVADIHPLLFAISVAFSGAAVTMSRPPANSLLLEQQEKDTGSASSLINSIFVFSGSMGMLFISVDWSNRILVLAIMNIVAGLGGFLFWLYARKKCHLPAHFI